MIFFCFDLHLRTPFSSFFLPRLTFCCFFSKVIPRWRQIDMIKSDFSPPFPTGSHNFILRNIFFVAVVALLIGQGSVRLWLGSISMEYTSCLQQGKVKSQIFGEREIMEEPRDCSRISSSSRRKHSSDITVATVGRAWNTEEWKLQFGSSSQMCLGINHSSFSFPPLHSL